MSIGVKPGSMSSSDRTEHIITEQYVNRSAPTKCAAPAKSPVSLRQEAAKNPESIDATKPIAALDAGSIVFRQADGATYGL